MLTEELLKQMEERASDYITTARIHTLHLMLYVHQLVREVRRLRQELRDYGQHDDGCYKKYTEKELRRTGWTDEMLANRTCTCGLDTAIGDEEEGKMTPKLERLLQRVCKWRTVFASWQLGTRSAEDAECQAVKDHREITLLLRMEVSALTKLLLDKGVFSPWEWEHQMLEEAAAMEEILERRFPGFRSSDEGMVIEPHIAVQTTKNWPP